MLVFNLSLAIVMFFSLFSSMERKKNKVVAKITFLLIAIVLSVVSGLRSNIGDTLLYKHYYGIVSEFNLNDILNTDFEPIFVFILMFLNKISSDPQLMVFVFGISTVFMNIYFLYKYEEGISLTAIIYICSGYYLVTMNGIRQAFVCAIIYMFTFLIFEKKYLKYLIMILVMYFVHSSALIMLPLAILSNSKCFSRITLAIVIAFIIVSVLFFPIMEGFFEVAENSRAAVYEDYILESLEGGANIIRLIIAMVPIVLAYIHKKKLLSEWKHANVFINFTIFNALFYFLALQNWIFARFTIYLTLFSFVLLSKIVQYCFKKKEKYFVTYTLIGFYIIFYYYEYFISLNIVYKSHFFS